MKNLIEYIEEGLLKGQERTLNSGESTSINVQRQEVIDFIKDNYYGVKPYDISKKPNKDGKFEINTSSSVFVKNGDMTSLTNGNFIFVRTGEFSIDLCRKLESLEGCPKEVFGIFSAYKCDSLKSLEYGPDFVANNYSIFGCKQIKSLKGCPKTVGGEFRVENCGKSFSVKDVEKLCNVTNKQIYV